MNDFSSGLMLTVLGMGLVFFSLLVVMFLIRGLDAVFPAKDEEDADVASSAAGESVAVLEEPPAAALVVPAATRTDLEMLVGGKRHAVTMKELAALPMIVAVDGEEHRIERGSGDQLVVDGQAFTVRVLESAEDHVTVGVGDDVFRVELPPAPIESFAEPISSMPNSAASVAASVEMVNAPLPGKVLRVGVKAGERVKRGQELCVIEAMKMENSIGAPSDGVISELLAQAGQVVRAGQPLVALGLGDGLPARVQSAATATPPKPAPATVAAPRPPAAPAGEPVNAPLPGRILRVSVSAGARVKRGQELCVIEAMKMENSIGAPRDGVVRDVVAQAGALIRAGQVLATLE